ncbi:MAG: biopolymer transporter ExbD [Planctomycetia bacterium]|nr:biopolymer transporter ExbD [Planctomycetia bacterium]MBL6915744.1 biopolymer transporter ExbD [Planctomycetota bacterium]
MAKKKRKIVLVKKGVDMDMTPMIDIVFLLIVFFMVVTELTVQQAVVVLPVASEATVEEPQPGSRILFVNVSFNSEGQEQIQLMNGPPMTPEELELSLRLEAEAYGGWEDNPNNPTQKLSTLEVTIRCDQGAKSGNIHKVFAACSKARIFKVRCAAIGERFEDPYKVE